MPFFIALILVLGVATSLLYSGWALAFIFTLFPLQQLLISQFSLFRDNQTLPNYIVVLVAVLAIGQRCMLSSLQFEGIKNASTIGSLGLYAWAAATLLWTPSTDGPSIVLLGLPYVILFVILAPMTIRTIDEVPMFRNGLLLLGSVTLLAIMISPRFSFWSGRLVFQFGSESRTNPLVIGELAALLLLAAVLWKLSGFGLLALLPRIAAIAIALNALLQSGSRGQLILVIAICVLSIPIARRIDNVFRLFGYGALGIVGLLALFYLAQNLNLDVMDRWRGDSMEEAVGGRVDAILTSLRYWVLAPSHWLMGLGTNAFTSPQFNFTYGLEGRIHNLLVELLTETGLIGLGIFAFIIRVAVKDARWLFDRFANDPERRASIGLLISFLGYQLLLAQKQSHLWGDASIFCLICIISRIRKVTELEELRMSEQQLVATRDEDLDDALIDDAEPVQA